MMRCGADPKQMPDWVAERLDHERSNVVSEATITLLGWSEAIDPEAHAVRTVVYRYAHPGWTTSGGIEVSATEGTRFAIFAVRSDDGDGSSMGGVV